MKRMKIIELKIYTDGINFDANLRHKCKHSEFALDVIEQFVKRHRKGERPDGQA